MMSHYSPKLLLFIGFVGLVVGVVLPFLMTIRVIEPTLLLNFLAYIASFGGLVVGIAGTVLYWQDTRREEEDWWRQ